MAKYVKFDKETWEADRAKKKADRKQKWADNAEKRKKIGKKIAFAGSMFGAGVGAALGAVKLWSMFSTKDQICVDYPMEEAGAEELPVETEEVIEGEV